MTTALLLENAIILATAAHAGQADKVGNPYILHPLRVMMACPDDFFTRIVAVLHDVVEDTNVSLDDITDAFGQDIAIAIDAITKRKGEHYQTYLQRVMRHSVAREVKLRDMEDNSSFYRMSRLPIKDQLRLIEKYTRARHYLLNGEWE